MEVILSRLESQPLYKDTSANYLLSLQTYKQRTNNFNTRTELTVPLDHLPSHGGFVPFSLKNCLTGIDDFYMQRQIQKHSIFKTSDLLNKLMIYQNLYPVSSGNRRQHPTGKHTISIHIISTKETRAKGTEANPPQHYCSWPARLSPRLGCGYTRAQC